LVLKVIAHELHLLFMVSSFLGTLVDRWRTLVDCVQIKLGFVILWIRVKF
jgi:hypothetical protein